MEEIIKEIYAFLTSTQFTMYLTAGLAIFAVVSKIVTQVQKTRNNLKLANYDAKVKTKELELKDAQAQREELKAENEQYKLWIEQIKKSIDNQNEALTIAFNNSNLNASAKLLVEEKLKAVDQIIIEAKESATKIQEKVVETAEVITEAVEPIVAPIVEEVKNYKRVR